MGNVLDCAADKPEDDEGKSTSISFDSDEASLCCKAVNRSRCKVLQSFVPATIYYGNCRRISTKTLGKKPGPKALFLVLCLLTLS